MGEWRRCFRGGFGQSGYRFSDSAIIKYHARRQQHYYDTVKYQHLIDESRHRHQQQQHFGRLGLSGSYQQLRQQDAAADQRLLSITYIHRNGKQRQRWPDDTRTFRFSKWHYWAAWRQLSGVQALIVTWGIVSTGWSLVKSLHTFTLLFTLSLLLTF